jgi:hypothetical protein
MREVTVAMTALGVASAVAAVSLERLKLVMRSINQLICMTTTCRLNQFHSMLKP